jgi:hypothetical protein
MKAWSIRQPWGWFILNAGKRVENRTTRWSYRGPILLHFGAGCTRAEYESAAATGELMRSDPAPRSVLPPLAELPRGGFGGIARIVACERHSYFPREDLLNFEGWKMGSVLGARPVYGYTLADVEELPFVEHPGALGIYDVEHVPTMHPAGTLPRKYADPTRLNFGEHAAVYLRAWARRAARS